MIPIYNVEHYLSACLASCVSSDHAGNYEIVAVNDGSTDRSGEILERFAAEHPQLVRWIRTENGGLGHARNTGLEMAEGEYILFLDSDDTLAPNAVGEILESLDGSFELGVFDFITVNEQGRQLAYTAGCERPEGAFTLENSPELIFSPPNAVNKLWRRSLFLASGIRFPDRLWFEDLATVPKLYLHAETVRYFKKGWYVYLQRGGSITNSADAARNRDMLAAIGSTLDYYRAQGQYERWEKELCYLALYHELLTSTTRVNLIDPHSPVQKELREDFLTRFPKYQNNPYLAGMPAKHKLLVRLIAAGDYRAVHLLMRANELARHKNR